MAQNCYLRPHPVRLEPDHLPLQGKAFFAPPVSAYEIRAHRGMPPPPHLETILRPAPHPSAPLEAGCSKRPSPRRIALDWVLDFWDFFRTCCYLPSGGRRRCRGRYHRGRPPGREFAPHGRGSIFHWRSGLRPGPPGPPGRVLPRPGHRFPVPPCRRLLYLLPTYFPPAGPEYPHM